jgi:hypothetical protein
MPRYGPPPTSDEPPAPPDGSALTRWSPGRKVLAVLASLGMVAAFVFNFLSPTSSGFKKKTTTTSSSSSTTSSSATTSTSATTTTLAPATSTTVLGRSVRPAAPFSR